MYHYSSLFLLGKPCCSQTLGQEKYRSHENCVNGTKTGTYHNTQMIKSATLDLKLRSFFILPRLFCRSSSSGLFFNLLTPKISKSRVVFGCQTFLVIVALVNWVFNQGMSRSLSSSFFFLITFPINNLYWFCEDEFFFCYHLEQYGLQGIRNYLRNDNDIHIHIFCTRVQV